MPGWKVVILFLLLLLLILGLIGLCDCLRAEFASFTSPWFIHCLSTSLIAPSSDILFGRLGVASYDDINLDPGLVSCGEFGCAVLSRLSSANGDLAGHILVPLEIVDM